MLDGDAVEADRTGPRTYDAGNGAVECRLADAVRTEHGDDLAGFDLKIDTAQYVGIAVAGTAVRGPRGAAQRWTCAVPTFAAAPWPR